MVNMKFRFSPDAFMLSGMSFLGFYGSNISPGCFLLTRDYLTLAGAMTSITFTILELKLSTRSSVEHGEGGGNMEMAFLKSELEYSLIYHFLIVFDLICMSGIKDISKKTQKWSDREGSITEISETLRPLSRVETIEMCPPFIHSFHQYEN